MKLQRRLWVHRTASPAQHRGRGQQRHLAQDLTAQCPAKYRSRCRGPKGGSFTLARISLKRLPRPVDARPGLLALQAALEALRAATRCAGQ